MGVERHRAAVEVWEIIQDADRLDELDGYWADDFVQVDRRRMIALPDLDGPGVVEMFRVGHEAGLEEFDVQQLAARGERLHLDRVVTRFVDGSVKEYLTVTQWNSALTKCERHVRFDVADVEAAAVELDRLHAGLRD